MLDGGAPFYDTYETQDGKYISVGSIEPQFYALLVEKAGLDAGHFDAATQHDRERWPGYKDVLTRVFKARTQAQWCDLMEGSDVCFAPVLSIFDAPTHPHHQQRNTFVDLDGVTQPAPAPRFSRTPPEVRGGARRPGEDSEAVLLEYGFSRGDIDTFRAKGVISAA
jgi:alpha-methylacyl-CoA racemase